MACFVGGHFALSSLKLRGILIKALGLSGFRAAYAFMSLVTLIWAIDAYGKAAIVEAWPAESWLQLVPLLLMPPACILAITGLTSRTVTMVGGEGMAREPDPVSGIVTVTRHPFLWGAGLWAIAHMAANGDLASLILFGGMALLSFGGMAHIDHRRRETLGADWGPIALSSSAIPFLAALQGRHGIDWRGIGWARLTGGIAVYVALAFAHPWIAGVAILPGLLP